MFSNGSGGGGSGGPRLNMKPIPALQKVALGRSCNGSKFAGGQIAHVMRVESNKNDR